MDYILRDIDPKWWARVKAQAARDQISLRDLMLKKLAEYLVKREGKSV